MTVGTFLWASFLSAVAIWQLDDHNSLSKPLVMADLAISISHEFVIFYNTHLLWGNHEL